MPSEFNSAILGGHHSIHRQIRAEVSVNHANDNSVVRNLLSSPVELPSPHTSPF